jgi:pyridoxal phosphate enzyme (YggS family)
MKKMTYNMSISDNIKQIRRLLPADVTLVCVSKYHSEREIMEAYECGERHFGESRVQELAVKYEHLPKDIKWHFIGHLQTNKVKQLLPMAYLIHSVDSLKLLQSIDTHAGMLGIKTSVLLEVHIAREQQKYGFTPNDIENALTNNSGSDIFDGLRHTDIAGLMGMATNTDNERQIANEFEQLHELFSRIHDHVIQTRNSTTDFNILSMGMTEDYHIALRHGTTMVRIGSGIFGERHNTTDK